MFHQLKQVIDPYLALSQTIENWDDIKSQLAESNRKRKPQMENYTKTS